MGHMSGFAESGTLVLPLWSAVIVAALFVVSSVYVLGRAGRDGVVEALPRIGLLLVGALLAWAFLDAKSTGNLAAQRRALDARLLEMTTRALVPGSPLACLDASAGDLVEAACEKALFATPEAAAASVTYVTAQLSLLADGSEFERRSGANYEAALGGLRHAVETDRFGIVAHVLADRDGCTQARCGTFRLLRDTSQVSENLSGHKYESYVLHHATDWFQSALSAMAANAPAPAAQAAPLPAPPAAVPPNSPMVASKTTSGSLYFPSSSSIPPISIMNAEPTGSSQQAAAPDASGKPATSAARKPAAAPPATQQARRPTNLAPGRPGGDDPTP